MDKVILLLTRPEMGGLLSVKARAIMAKRIVFLILLILIVGLSACGNDAAQPSSLETDSDNTALVESPAQEIMIEMAERVERTFSFPTKDGLVEIGLVSTTKDAPYTGMYELLHFDFERFPVYIENGFCKFEWHSDKFVFIEDGVETEVSFKELPYPESEPIYSYDLGFTVYSIMGYTCHIYQTDTHTHFIFEGVGMSGFSVTYVVAFDVTSEELEYSVYAIWANLHHARIYNDSLYLLLSDLQTGINPQVIGLSLGTLEKFYHYKYPQENETNRSAFPIDFQVLDDVIKLYYKTSDSHDTICEMELNIYG